MADFVIEDLLVFFGTDTGGCFTGPVGDRAHEIVLLGREPVRLVIMDKYYADKGTMFDDRNVEEGRQRDLAKHIRRG